MKERLQFNIDLPFDKDTNGNYLVEDIKRLIKENQTMFYGYLHRLIDCGDSRLEIHDDSMDVEELTCNGDEYTAEVSYWSGIYMGCKDMNSESDHYAVLPFSIENGVICVDIELPHPWTPH